MPSTTLIEHEDTDAIVQGSNAEIEQEIVGIAGSGPRVAMRIAGEL